MVSKFTLPSLHWIFVRSRRVTGSVRTKVINESLNRRGCDIAKCVITAGRKDPLSSRTGWLKPFLFWLAITLRILFFHVPITIITKPMHLVWENTVVRFANLLPDRYKKPLGAFVVVAVIVIGGFASPESQDNTRDVLDALSLACDIH